MYKSRDDADPNHIPVRPCRDNYFTLPSGTTPFTMKLAHSFTYLLALLSLVAGSPIQQLNTHALRLPLERRNNQVSVKSLQAHLKQVTAYAMHSFTCCLRYWPINIGSTVRDLRRTRSIRDMPTRWACHLAQKRRSEVLVMFLWCLKMSICGMPRSMLARLRRLSQVRTYYYFFEVILSNFQSVHWHGQRGSL